MSVTLHTSLGDIKIEVFADLVPIAAEKFLKLCASNSYDGNKFHRNIKAFAIQCGKSVESIDISSGNNNDNANGISADEFHSDLKFDRRGLVAFASPVQFFITYAPQEQLNNQYPIFGQIVGDSGTMLTLSKMENSTTNAKNKPLVDIKIRDITIHANPLATA